MKRPELIKAKDLKKTDLWKYNVADRYYHTAIEIIDLDSEESHQSAILKNKILVLEGDKRFLLDKEQEIIRHEYESFQDFIRNHIEYK